MTIFALIIALIVLGVIYWAIGFVDFIAEPFKRLIGGVLVVIAVILIVVWLLGLLGVGGAPALHLK